jgi:AcrR family transcriptional regulator
MRDRIVEAAVRVLAEEGALGFTTTKVADEAGVSVGSLYQYFPNKHALVLAIHRDIVRRGWDHVQTVLDDPHRSAQQKVADIARWYFATESAEASQLGAVFDDVEIFLRHGQDDELLDSEVLDRFATLVASQSPRKRRPEDDQFAAQIIMTTLEAVGKSLAPRHLSDAERERWAVAISTMLCDHLEISDP